MSDAKRFEAEMKKDADDASSSGINRRAS